MKYLYSLIFGMVCTLFGFGIVFHIVKFSLVIVAVYLLVVTALSIWINKKHHNHFTIGLPVVSLLFGIIYEVAYIGDKQNNKNSAYYSADASGILFHTHFYKVC